MRLWILNNYNMLPEHGQLNRAYYFGKSLSAMGHEPVVFVGSHPHNTSLQLIEDRARFRQSEDCAFPWVLVKTCNYEGSRLKRVYSMFQYYFNARKAAAHYAPPDVIIGSSAHPLAAVLALRLAKRYHCKGIVEIRDLWPESIVAYGIASKRHPVIQLLYRLEKRLYAKADAVIFTMEGGRDYIIEKGWDTAHGGPVDLRKVFHINNGVDLAAFDENRVRCAFADPDLDDPDTFKVVYTGSIRAVNALDILLRTAEAMRSPDAQSIRFLIYGDGDQRERLMRETEARGLRNVRFKGSIRKECVPYVLSRADVCLLHWQPTPITKFGMSMNKTFEYFAAGRPIFSNAVCGYDLIRERRCGLAADVRTAEEYADGILTLRRASKEDYARWCRNARSAAEDYDYRKLTEKLLEVIDHAEKQDHTGAGAANR